MNPKVALGLVCVVVLAAIGLVLEVQITRELDPPDLRSGKLPIGRLGHPLGSLIKVEGMPIQEGLSHGACTLKVETVNGKKLAQPVEIWVEDVGELFEGNRYVLEGYESLRMIGMAPAREEIANRKGQFLNRPQAGWGIYTFFVPLAGEMPTSKGPLLPKPSNDRTPYYEQYSEPSKSDDNGFR